MRALEELLHTLYFIGLFPAFGVIWLIGRIYKPFSCDYNAFGLLSVCLGVVIFSGVCFLIWWLFALVV
jgi:hypothetical protein